MKRFNKEPECNSEQGIYTYGDNHIYTFIMDKCDYYVYYCKLSWYDRNILIDLYPPTITNRYGIFF